METSLVNLRYSCHICNKILADASGLKRHYIKLHQIFLPSRPEGGRSRVDTGQYTYITQQNDTIHSSIQLHYACLSCLAHYPNMEDLAAHIDANHLALAGTSRSTRTHSRADDAHGQDTEQSCPKRSCHMSTDSPPPILNSKNALFKFTSPQQPYQALEVSRISAKIIDALAPIVTIVSPCNSSLSSDHLLDLQKQKGSHASLSSLKKFPEAFSFLVSAMNQPLGNLPAWLWGHPIDKGSALSTMEKQLIQTMRFILTDFANSNTNEQMAPFSDVSERTFLISNVVPIFKTFGHQTNQLCFNWCEPQTMQQTRQSRVMVNIGQLDETTLRFVDGLGFDRDNNERLTLEVSGGRLSDDHLHASDDTLKIIHILMCILKGDARSHANASLATYKLLKAFGVQTVQDTVILSEMTLGDDYKYCFKEVLTAAIPVNDRIRSKWLPIFNLLAYLMVQLDDQVNIVQRLQGEHNGLHAVDQKDALVSMLYQE
ncbi:hypothetical protein DM01DRAFT_1338443 [Hesseltinella vesiculosa]|uniref:C2H2-type domain-containing protein n=1 Tax=Hesseltinella vesiculosa TaxID=101127 RepID=A0A1X2GA04_9FUNG|nr:hypothetical protein DM01DRAFT_1338443 [Hesseltinella vesiculosa]